MPPTKLDQQVHLQALELNDQNYASKVLGRGRQSNIAKILDKVEQKAAAQKRKNRAAKLAQRREQGKHKPVAKKPKRVPKKKGRPKLTEEQKKANRAKRRRERAEMRKADPNYKPRPRKKAKHADKTDKQLEDHMKSLKRKDGKRQCSDAFIKSVIDRRKAARKRREAQQKNT